MCLRLILLYIFLGCGALITDAKTMNFYDSVWLTKATRNAHKTVMAGIPGLVESSDPIFIEKIEGKIPDLELTLRNAKFIGLADCVVELTKIDKLYLFDYNLMCPLIVVVAEYEVKGNIAGYSVNGQGNCSVSAKEYQIQFHGSYEKYQENGGLHLKVLDFNVTAVAKGDVKTDIQSLVNGDQAKSQAIQKFVNDNWKDPESVVRKPVLNAFMKKFMKNINDYLKAVPADVMFSQ